VVRLVRLRAAQGSGRRILMPVVAVYRERGQLEAVEVVDDIELGRRKRTGRKTTRKPRG
jgi:hypothetical protein